MRIKTTRLSFDTLHLEGGLFVPDLLEKTALGTAPGQTVADYKLPRGLRLSDEYGRAFQIALAAWKAFEIRGKSEEFVLEVFRDCLGFSAISKPGNLTVADLRFPVEYLLTASVPLVIAPKDWGLDDSQARWAVEGTGSRKKTSFQLAQEFLNASEHHTWAVVTNGSTVRLLRDSQNLVRPNWLEFDLGTILKNERYADFKAFWLILHSSRAPLDSSEEGIWGQWRTIGIEEGSRVREGLSDGVTKALIALGTGFLKGRGPGNDTLRQQLLSGDLPPQGYYQEILRLVYRFLFLFTIEERGFLHPGDRRDPAVQRSQTLYSQGYSMARLRDRCLQIAGYDRYADLWNGVQVVFSALNRGESRLDLPALGGVFASYQCPLLDSCELPNRALLEAMHHLRWSRLAGNLALIDYKNMGPEELGSVYESLLELVPTVDLSSKTFAFVGVNNEAGSTAGNARKASGSYYTPDSLVQELIKSTLEPVLAAKIAAAGENKEDAILSCRVVDPACGSGHFLMAAARRLAERLAEVRSSDGSVRSQDYRHAIRDVVAHCIFGVDVNPLAIELVKMTLWIEGFEPGKPLSFLDHHIKCGNSLLGTNSELLANGIPDEAFKSFTGDDDAVLKHFRQLNVEGRSRQSLFSFDEETETSNLKTAYHHVEEMSDETLEAIQSKAKSYHEYLSSDSFLRTKAVADVWVSAFLQTKCPGQPPITQKLLKQVEKNLAAADPVALAVVRGFSESQRIFHWHLEFPEVLGSANKGFDCVLGNPPWEKINFKDEEYFAVRHPEIAEAPNKAARKKMLEALQRDNPKSYAEYETAKNIQDRLSFFFRHSGVFPLTGVSRINLYSVFAELSCSLIAPKGRLGMVLASGIATDDNNKELFFSLTNAGRLAFVYDFENREGIFKDVDSRFKFALFCALGSQTDRVAADFAFYLTNTGQLLDPERHFTLTGEELHLLNPNSKTCPTFRNKQEAELTKYIYSQVPAWELHEKTEEWPGKPKTPFNMSNDSDLFVEATELASKHGNGIVYLPLYESKFTHQFNHRFATFEGGTDDNAREFSDEELVDSCKQVKARYYLDKSALEDRYPGRWFPVYRKIARSTDERTCISCILPQVPCGDSLILLENLTPATALVLVSETNSTIHDFCSRQKVAGMNFNHWIWHQIPILRSVEYDRPCSWAIEGTSRKSWLIQRSLELTYTAWDLKAFADDLGYKAPPFKWNPDRRFLIQCEIDAAYFYWYLGDQTQWDVKGSSAMKKYFSTPRQAVEYVLGTFPTLNDRDQAKYGEPRTKNTILRLYDAMNESSRTGIPFRSELAPPPGDPRQCHRALSDGIGG
jgi:hypothetical protein